MESSGFKHPLFELLYSLSTSFSRFQHLDYIPMIEECLPLYNEIHAQVDELLKSTIHRSAFNSDTPEEEDKENNSSQLFQKFVQEAQAVREEVQRLSMVKKNDASADRLAEPILSTERKIKQWKKDYQSVQEQANLAMQQFLRLFIKFKNSLPLKPQEESNEQILASMKQYPYKSQMCSNFLSYKSLLQTEINQRGYNFEAKFQQRKKALMLELEKLQFQELVKNRKAELPEDLVKIESTLDCTNGIITKLKEINEDVSPQMMIEMSRTLFQVQRSLNELQKQGQGIKFEGGAELEKKQILERIYRMFNDFFDSSSFSSRLLYKVKGQESKMLIYDIEKNTVKKVQLNFVVPKCAGMTHVEQDFVIGGGMTAQNIYLKALVRINSLGKNNNFGTLPVAKCSFPLVYYKKENSLITLGGIYKHKNLQEVNQLSLQSNNWKTLPQTPSPCFSSAVIINETYLYYFHEYSLYYLNLDRNYSQQWSNYGIDMNLPDETQPFSLVAAWNQIICFNETGTYYVLNTQRQSQSNSFQYQDYSYGYQAPRFRSTRVFHGLKHDNDYSIKVDQDRLYAFIKEDPYQVYSFSKTTKNWQKHDIH